MKKCRINIMLLTITVTFLIFLVPYNNIVSSSYIIYQQGFEEQVNGADMNIVLDPNDFMQSKEMTSILKISNTQKHSGLLSLKSDTSTGYLNFTYDISNYLTNFTFNYYHSDGSHTYLKWYNNTLGVSQPIIYMDFVVSGSFLSYFYENNVPNVLDTWGGGYSGFYRYSWNIDTNTGICTYTSEHGSIVETGFVNNAIAINNNYRIDRLYIQDLSVSYYDDITYKISTSYNETETQGGCIDTDDYEFFSKNIEQQNGYLDYNTPFIEFTSASELTLSSECFELYVGSGMIDNDIDTNNYRLYINGLNIGTSQCIYFLAGNTYVIQWDLSTLSNFTEETLVFEVYHSIKFDGNNYWNIAVATPNLLEGPPSPTSVTYKNTATNGVLDGTPVYQGACWKLYYSSFGASESEENNDFTVGINLIEFNPSHPLYDIPFSYNLKTVWFEIFSNRTDGFYYVNVSDDDTHLDVGQTQGYPKTIYAYHTILGWTPYAESNYTVRLCKISDDTIVDSKTFNITETNIDYAIWTFPNPSNYGGQHGVGVYIEDDTEFNVYFIVGSSSVENSLSYEDASTTVKVGALDLNGFWSTSVMTFMIGASEYWRIWGTDNNETFIPLTSTYEHYVNSLTQYNYIDSSLTNDEGIIGESFNIFGQHSHILSSLSVFQNNNPILDVSTDYSFMIPITLNTKGTYVFSLRIYNDGVWEIIDSVTITMFTEDEYKGTSYKIEPPLSYILGSVIVVIFIMIPILLTRNSDVEGSVIQFASFIMAIVGLVIDTLLYLFPVWVLGAVIVIGGIIIAILWLNGHTNN